MAIPKEAIETITNFCPPKATDRREKGRTLRELGQIDGDRLVYGWHTYPKRVTGVPGEPIVSGQTTTQPVVLLVRGKNVIPLAYPTDVRALGDDLAAKVADHLAALKER